MAMKKRRGLFERDIHDALVMSSRKIIRLAEKRLAEMDESDEGREWWAWEKATATEIIEQYDRKNLRTQVHIFLNKYPILLSCPQKEVVMAFIKEVRERLAKEAITHIMFEEDENGEPRFIYAGDEKFKKNPKFIEPPDEEDENENDEVA